MNSKPMIVVALIMSLWLKTLENRVKFSLAPNEQLYDFQPPEC